MKGDVDRRRTPALAGGSGVPIPLLVSTEIGIGQTEGKHRNQIHPSFVAARKRVVRGGLCCFISLSDALVHTIGFGGGVGCHEKTLSHIYPLYDDLSPFKNSFSPLS